MDEQDLMNLKDLRFTITENMKLTIIDMLVIQQILEDDVLSKKDIKLLQREKEKLLRRFRNEFQAYNPTQVAIIRAYLSGK